MVGSITIQVGADATTTGRFTADSFKYQQLYAEQDEEIAKDGWVGSVVHATDADKGKPGPGGAGVRVWASAIKLHSYTLLVPPSTEPKDQDWVGEAKRDTWYGDDAQLIETSRQDFVDIAGIASADATQKEMQNGAVLVKKTSYAVAVLCWKDDKLNGKPLDSFYYSTDITIKKDSVNVVVDFGQVYSAGGVTIADWSALKNDKTGNSFTPPPKVIKNPFF